uniref:Uncharacterized protein n=1 Tax=Rhizophora mucronata TaxID=61149 RepID=A0A2P2IKL6_RHIMU
MLGLNKLKRWEELPLLRAVVGEAKRVMLGIAIYGGGQVDGKGIDVIIGENVRLIKNLCISTTANALEVWRPETCSVGTKVVNFVVHL